MNTRIVKCQVKDEYVIGAGVPLGAEGSHDDVLLELTFSDLWQGLTKSITWWNALGEPVRTILAIEHIDTDNTNVYRVPVPAEAKAAAGDMEVTIKGAYIEEDIEKRATVSVTAQFKVLPGKWADDAEDVQDVTPSQAEQIQAGIDKVMGDIILSVKASESAQASEKAAAEAAASAAASEMAAEKSRSDAESAKNEAESAKKEAVAAKIDAETAKNAFEPAEAGRASAEEQRVQAEAGRVTAEKGREDAETRRENAEIARGQEEESRKESEEARNRAEQERVSGEAAREKAETARSAWEDYDGDRTYEPGNKVAYQGNSYLNKKVCRGVEPTDTECWLLIARKGSQGDQGAPGKIADVYETLSQLRASLPEGDEQMYQVAEDGLCYIWSERSVAWVSCGRFQGPAAEPEEVPVILRAQAWQGENAPWQLTVEVPGLLKNSLGDIGLAENATTEERAVARAALISVTAQEAGSVTMITDGKKPEVDLPAVVHFYANVGESGSGSAGQDGVGIQSVEQTTTSTEDGGANIVTITKTDGTTSTFTVRNGSKGSTGTAGKDGKDGQDGATPQKGTDYWTAEDKQAIVDDVLAALPTWTGGSY